MKINAIPPAELERFAAAAQPTARAVIEEQLGDEGVAMPAAVPAHIQKIK